MTTPEYNALDRQLRQLQLERFQGLHAYSERATEENERQIEVVRRQMAKLRKEWEPYKDRSQPCYRKSKTRQASGEAREVTK